MGQETKANKKQLLLRVFREYIMRVYFILFSGTIIIRKTKIPKAMFAGIIGVIFLYISVAGVVSVATPWWARGDTRQHIDYTWRLYNGDIPKRTDGIRYEKFIELGGKKAQAASANPPLFYAMQAPIIGPLLNSGEWEKAIGVGRTVNLLTGVLCILVLAWGGWLFGGKRKAVFAVAVPALTVTMYRFTRLNVDFALDALLVLLSTLTVIFLYKMLTQGVQKKYLLILACLSMLGMATKAPYVVFLGLTIAAIPVAALLQAKDERKKRVIRATAISLAILGLVMLAVGWFYYFWNYTVYGNWFTARPPQYTGGRATKTLADVLLGRSLWQLFYGDFARDLAVSTATTSFALAGFFTIRKTQIKKWYIDKNVRIGVILLSFVVVGVFITQIEHAVGIGSVNFRYMLPALLPIGLFLSFGLLQFKWTRGQLVAFASTAFAAISMLALARNGIYTITNANGVSIVIPTLLVGLFVPGALLLSGALYKLTQK